MNPPRFIIRYRGARGPAGGSPYALHFHENCTGKTFSLVADADASVFSTAEEATAKAIAHGLHPDNAELCNAPERQAA